MEMTRPTSDEAEAGLRAMKGVLGSDGTLNPVERGLMDAAQRHVLGTALDIDALAPIAPEELGEARRAARGAQAARDGDGGGELRERRGG